MKAWRVHAWGEPESIQLDDVAEPLPGPEEVKIRNHAAALNFFDVLQIQGKYQAKPPFPFVPGAEVAGIVERVGAGVRGMLPGDRVLAMSRGNGFAECTTVKAFRVFPIPDGMSFEEAAVLPIAYHTSYFALTERTTVRPGETMLVHAGASGVGMAAIRIGRALGARVLATAGSQEKRDSCIAQGAECVFDYSDPTWVDRVREATRGRGADLIYDPVGGDIFDQSTKCTAPEGRVLVIGFASGRIPVIAANRVLLKNISVVGVLWGAYIDQHADYPAHVHAVLSTWFSEGKIRPVVGASYPFERVREGLRDLASRRVIGKAALRIEN